MASPHKLAHVVYQTRRYDEMIAWYVNVFEAEVVHQDSALAFIAYDDEHHRLAFANLDILKSERKDHSSSQGEIGVNHVAFTFKSLGDLLATYDRLKAESILPYWPIHHGPTLSLYYQDPDGNRIEFQVDACSSEDANAFMKSEAFEKNPLGVVIDPEDLTARYRNGATEEELLGDMSGEPSVIPAEHGLT
ncbi:MAG: VOC family protein [Pseudomonadales bacterium]